MVLAMGNTMAVAIVGVLFLTLMLVKRARVRIAARTERDRLLRLIEWHRSKAENLDREARGFRF
jgi:uncharacterized membrane protein